MLKILSTALFLFITFQSQAQNLSLSDKNLDSLNAKISLLKDKYKNSIPLIVKSFPQATANYFELITQNPKTFFMALEKAKGFEELTESFPNLLIDKDLLIIKNIYRDYNKIIKIDINSFEIGNGGEHRVTLKYTDSLNYDGLRYFYSSYNHNGKTTISGFYLKTKFKITELPAEYADWINYNDILIEPEKPIFLPKPKTQLDQLKFKKNIFDTLTSYFNNQTNKPKYIYGSEDKILRQNMEKWESQHNKFADSLYQKDTKFKELLNSALLYAEKNLVSNEGLEKLALVLLPKETNLNLLRQQQMDGTCSYDDRPLHQLKNIAHLSAETSNWTLYIKATLNVLNDHVSRVANSNIASENRKTYVEELSRLDLNLNNLLLGSNLRIADTSKTHYFSDGSKVAQAYANLDKHKQKEFEKAIEDIIRNPTIDSFNKLHFYNTFLNYKYFLKDSLKVTQIDHKIKKLIPFLPKEINSRITNRNKLLTDMLYQEESLLSKFNIISSTVGDIYSYNYGGKCWKAKLIEKNTSKKIVYDLTMPIGEQLTPLNNFITKMDSLKLAANRNPFIQKQLKKHLKNELHIEFTNDKSFANYKNNTTDAVPIELLPKLDFQNAISTYIDFPDHTYIRYILLRNHNVLAITPSKDIGSKEKCQLFDKNGKLLNY